MTNVTKTHGVGETYAASSSRFGDLEFGVTASEKRLDSGTSGDEEKQTPQFSRSESQVQGMQVSQPAEQKASTPKAASENAFSEEIETQAKQKKGFFEHRLGPEHLFGSLMAAVYIYRWSKGVKSALPNELVGPAENRAKGIGGVASALKNTEKPFLLAGMVGSLLVNVGIALSARGAEVPEGDTLGQRVVNTLKHPNQSAMQLNAILMGATLTAISSSKLKSGLEGVRANEKGTLAYTESMASVLSGVAYLISNPIVFLGIMGIKRNKEANAPTQEAAKEPDAKTATSQNPEQTVQKVAAETQDSPTFAKSKTRILSADNLKAAFEPYSPKSLKASFSHALKHDKKGLTARTLAVAAEIGFIVEGTMRMKKVQSGAYSDVSMSEQDAIMAKGKAARNFGIMGVIVTVGQGAYTYGRLYMDSLKAQGQNNAVTMAR
jgi:hypothetical protein